jgi:hypothetical protein
LVKGAYDDTFYQPDVWTNVNNELSAFATTKHINLVVADTIAYDPTSRLPVIGAVSLGAGWAAEMSHGGIAMSSHLDLSIADPENYCDDRDIREAFDIVPHKGDWTLDGRPLVGKYVSAMWGAFAHELGHSFGLPHRFLETKDVGFSYPVEVDLLGNGFRFFRGAVGKGNTGDGSAASVIDPVSRIVLESSRFFNEGPFTDSVSPKIDILGPSSPSALGENVAISYDASDLDGAGLAGVVLIVDGETQDGNKISGTDAHGTLTFKTWKPGAQQAKVRVYDAHGNTTESSPISISTQ